MVGTELFDKAIEHVTDKYPKIDAENKKRLAQAFIDGGIFATTRQWKSIVELSPERIMTPELRKSMTESLPFVIYNEVDCSSALIQQKDMDVFPDGDVIPFTHFIHTDLPM